jgi:hypothetical protein
MNWTTFFQKFGKLEARSEQAAKDAGEIKEDLRHMKDTMSELKSFQDRQKGMWFAVATIAAFVGAVVTLVARYIGALMH